MRRDDPDQTRGRYEKWAARRTDGSSEPGGKHEFCRLFTLDLDHDEHARPALAVYANEVREDFPDLARDLFELLRSLPEPEIVDPVPRPTSDGRPDAVPPLSPVEAVLAFAQYFLSIPGTRQGPRMDLAVTVFCQQQGFTVPRRGWQSIVRRPGDPSRAGGVQ